MVQGSLTKLVFSNLYDMTTRKNIGINDCLISERRTWTKILRDDNIIGYGSRSSSLAVRERYLNLGYNKDQTECCGDGALMVDLH